MTRTLLRMERPAGIAAPSEPSGVVIRRWDRNADRELIPVVYGTAFGHDPWPPDWDGFVEFDPEGVFVAESGRRVVGFSICFVRGDHGYISVVAVLPDQRRRGIASSLVSAAIGHLASGGASTVRIDAYADAPAAVATYRSLGFEVYDTVEDEDADPRGSAEE